MGNMDGGIDEVGVLTGCCHCTGGGYAIVMERGAGTDSGCSGQFLTCIGGLDCGAGIDKLGSGGSLCIDECGSKDLLIGACSVGINGALLYGPGANP